MVVDKEILCEIVDHDGDLVIFYSDGTFQYRHNNGSTWTSSIKQGSNSYGKYKYTDTDAVLFKIDENDEWEAFTEITKRHLIEGIAKKQFDNELKELIK